MEKTLELRFLTDQGKNRSLTIRQPKEGLDEASVRQAMTHIQQAKLFQTEGVHLYDRIQGARYIHRQVVDIFNDPA